MGKRENTVFFLGTQKKWSLVHDYYVMMRDAYEHALVSKCRRMTAAKRLYFIGFKMRVDNAAIALGLPERMQLPANIDQVTSGDVGDGDE